MQNQQFANKYLMDLISLTFSLTSTPLLILTLQMNLLPSLILSGWDRGMGQESYMDVYFTDPR